ncbi:hypothetical protein H0W91_00885 [Patescibacteria group bacterium]|nr:hypothetical protein [Patescibacteria group bacterium]
MFETSQDLRADVSDLEAAENHLKEVVNRNRRRNPAGKLEVSYKNWQPQSVYEITQAALDLVLLREQTENRTARVANDEIPLLQSPNLAQLTPCEEFKEKVDRVLKTYSF